MDLVVRSVANVASDGLAHFANSKVVQEAVARAVVILAAGAVVCGVITCAKWNPNGPQAAA